ncbi:MAG TPA: hypothetical protein VI815_02380 [Candidatus Nanoarchaeia archaeon]|nr:hypothetical protein [Candidatus Nanoarchaeia archaeon]
MKHLQKHLLIIIEKVTPELRILITNSKFGRKFNAFFLNDEDSQDFHFIIPSDLIIHNIDEDLRNEFGVLEFQVCALLPDKIYTSIDSSKIPNARFLEDAAEHLETQAQVFIQRRNKSPEQFLSKMLDRILLFAIDHIKPESIEVPVKSSVTIHQFPKSTS